MNHRPIPTINAGSMADIAFLLLVFFLVTTTLDQDVGIQTILPPAIINHDISPRIDRNVLEILVNGADELMIEGERTSFSEIKRVVRLFYTNPDQSRDFPLLNQITPSLCVQKLNTLSSSDPKNSKLWESWEQRQEATRLIGSYNELPKTAVISLQTDRSTSYATYILVQNELNAGLNRLRNECSLKNFGVPYSELNENQHDDQMKIRAIRMAFPRRISEAEPVGLDL